MSKVGGMEERQRVPPVSSVDGTYDGRPLVEGHPVDLCGMIRGVGRI